MFTIVMSMHTFPATAHLRPRTPTASARLELPRENPSANPIASVAMTHSRGATHERS